MDIRKLEAFFKVYELGSFSRAGEKLFLSQPTISAHVSSLEQELGVRLFDRLGRTILPTQAGEVLYRRGREAMSGLEVAREEIKKLHDRVAGRLEIGGSTIPATHLLPPLLTGFLNRFPEVQLHLRVYDTAGVIEQVEAGKILLGVVGAATDNDDLEFETLAGDELVVVGRPDFLGGNGNKAGEAELGKWPWIVRESGSGTRKAFERAIKDSGMDVAGLNTRLTVDSTQAALQCVLAGLGVSVTSRRAAEPYIKCGELVELESSFTGMQRSIYLVMRKNRYLFPVASTFVDYLKSECQ
jgi:DNA-binding transcriptional LysR family regulator